MDGEQTRNEETQETQEKNGNIENAGEIPTTALPIPIYIGDTKSEPIKILGQEIPYPQSIFSTLAIIGFFTAVCVLMYFFMWGHPENAEKISRIWSVTVSPITNKETKIVNTYQMQFWTPSAKTSKSEKAADWEKKDFDTKIRAFQEALDNLYELRIVKGYRRTEVFGSGRSGAKYGYWWVVSVNETYKVRDLAEQYKSIWNPDRDMYFEVTQSDQGYGEKKGKKKDE